jgi:hypothetical protein
MDIITINDSLNNIKLEGICYNGGDVKIRLIWKNMVLVVPCLDDQVFDCWKSTVQTYGGPYKLYTILLSTSIFL